MERLFERATVRERTIWPAFVYPGPFDADVLAMRGIVFGLYAMSYRHGFDYLETITYAELQRLLEQYESAMAELDADQQAFVIDTASRRYVDAVERSIRALTIETKRKGVDAKELEVGYKEDALRVDYKELQTRREQIQLAKDKAEMTIRELEVRIELEGLEQKQVEIELSRRQLEFQRTQLAVIQAVLKGIDIQIAVSEAALALVEADAEKARLIADLASMDAQIARTALAKLELEIDEEELAAIIYDIEQTLHARLALIMSRKSTAEAEIEGLEGRIDRAALLHLADLDEQIARTQAALQRLADRKAEALQRRDIRIADAEQEYENQASKVDNQIEIAIKRTDIPRVRKASQRLASEAAIEAAETTAKANIVNTLTHQIMKA